MLRHRRRHDDADQNQQHQQQQAEAEAEAAAAASRDGETASAPAAAVDAVDAAVDAASSAANQNARDANPQNHPSNHPPNPANPTRLALLGILYSLLLRTLSFLLNIITKRFVSPETLGRADVTLDLLLGTVLFIGREGFRLGLGRGGVGGGAAGDGGETDAEPAAGSEVGSEQPDESALANDGPGGGRSTDEARTLSNRQLQREKELVEEQKQQQRLANTAHLSLLSGSVATALALVVHFHHCAKLFRHDADDDDGVGADTDMVGTAGSSTASSSTATNDYLYGGLLYLLAALLEMLSEPYQLACLRSLDVDSRAAAEGCGNLGRAVTNVILLGGLLDRLLGAVGIGIGIGIGIGGGGGGGGKRDANIAQRYPICCFGFGHCVHAVLLGVVLRWRKRGQVKGPRWITTRSSDVANEHECTVTDVNETNESSAAVSKQKVVGGISYVLYQFHIPTLRLISIFTAQSIFKHLLTEGDRIVLTLLGNSYDRGVYGMASSIGGIASRMLLQPVEENARLLFGRLGSEVAAAAAPSSTSSSGGSRSNAVERKRKLQVLETTYTTLIKLVLYLGLIFAALGSNYTSILLRLLAGNKWGSNVDATAALSAFCVYTALLALNGTTEAFVYGTASTYRDVGVLSTVHAVVTVVSFGMVAPLLVNEYGTVGLVGANCLAMTLRSLYSIYFAAVYFCRWSDTSGDSSDRRKDLKENGAPSSMAVARKMFDLIFQGILPKTLVLVLFVASYWITGATKADLLTFEQQLVEHGHTVRIASRSWLLAAGKHVGIGAGCAATLAVVAYMLEMALRRDVWTLMRRKVD